MMLNELIQKLQVLADKEHGDKKVVDYTGEIVEEPVISTLHYYSGEEEEVVRLG